MDRVRARSTLLHDALAHEHRITVKPSAGRKPLQAKNANKPAGQNFSKTMEALALFRQVQMTPKPEKAPKVASPALFKAKFKGLELQHQLNQDAYNQWNQDMKVHLRHTDIVDEAASTPLRTPIRQNEPAEPTEHSTPMQKSFTELSHRMSGVTSQFCDNSERGLKFYPRAVQEGMHEIRELVKLTKSGGDGLVNLGHKLNQISQSLDPEPQMSDDLKERMSSLRSKINEVRDLVPESAPISAAEKIRGGKMMDIASNKVSELMSLLEKESSDRSRSRATSPVQEQL